METCHKAQLHLTYTSLCGKLNVVKETQQKGEIVMAKGVIVLCEVGVLLLESDNEFNNYNHVWNKKFGFYNENDILYKEKDMEEAIQYAKDYVEQGVNMTYAIIGNEGVCAWDEPFDDGDLDVIAGKYDMEDVLYSVAKIDGKIVENFLGKME